MIKVENLSKIYSTGLFRKKYFKAVDDVSFKVRKGKCIGIVGESGSGKSTIGQCITRLIEPTKGNIIYDGINITNISKRQLNEIRKKIQIIFQDSDSSLDPRMTIGESICEAIKLNTKNKDEIKTKLERLIEIVGLHKEHISRYPYQLSGGQNQRASLARVLSFEPSVIIADEPTSALDISVQAQIFKLLMDIKEKNNMTMILICHDLDIVKNTCDDIAIMHKGKIVEQGAVKDVFKNPTHPYTKMLINYNDENINLWKECIAK